MHLVQSLKAWGSSEFESIAKGEIEHLSADQLPLQEGLSRGSHALGDKLSAVILAATETNHTLRIKAGLFYTSVIAGSCCADDPTPVEAEQEYCELEFNINTATADTVVALLE